MDVLICPVMLTVATTLLLDTDVHQQDVHWLRSLTVLDRSAHIQRRSCPRLGIHHYSVWILCLKFNKRLQNSSKLNTAFTKHMIFGNRKINHAQVQIEGLI